MAQPGIPRWAAAVLGLVALVAPLAAPNDYWIGVMARICLYATLALGLNIVVGFAGLLDLGYVAFFGIGSYLYTFLASAHFGLHLPFLVTLPIVILLTAGSGILIGAPSFTAPTSAPSSTADQPMSLEPARSGSAFTHQKSSTLPPMSTRCPPDAS